jgi:hypothetical protein
MALFNASANYIENTQKADHDAQRLTVHDAQGESGSLKFVEMSSKIEHQLRGCKSYSVHVDPAKKINGVWTFSLTVSVIPSGDIPVELATPSKGKIAKWSLSRHYNQFRYVFDSIPANHHLKSWFNFPPRVLFNTETVMKERHISFSKLMEFIAQDPELNQLQMVTSFLNPFDTFEKLGS